MNEPFRPSDFSMLATERATVLGDIVRRWKTQNMRVGFVPTMGALHEGHLSLVELAKNHADKVVVSIFVNPAQFAPHEDFASYPRDLHRDLAMLQRAGVDLAYTPSERDIYPDGIKIIKAGMAAQGLESDFRPHFFDGVVSVVNILFEQVQPNVAVFGEKDFQQLMVIREMAEAEKWPVEILGAPIVRDGHGLALSSRNAYLSPDDLEIARMMNQIIYKAAFDLNVLGEEEPEIEKNKVLKEAEQSLLTCGFDKVDYVATRWNRVLGAAWIGKTRLIDNCEV